MTGQKVAKVTRVKITPMHRLRILTNQRMNGFRDAKQITPEFISDLIGTSEKQMKALARTGLLAAIYLAVMYTAYSGSGVKIALLGVDFSDVPRLLEISIALFSFSLFYLGVQTLNMSVHRQTIDSMVGSVIADDEIFQSLLKYRHAPLMNFFFPFRASLKLGEESINPVGITKVFNGAMITVALTTFFVVYLIPMAFMLFFAVPSLTVGIGSLSIGLLAWSCSLFLILSFLCGFLKLPYDETTYVDIAEGEVETK